MPLEAGGLAALERQRKPEPSVRDLVLRQRVVVESDYDVWFTRDVFAASNPLFADALGRREPGRRHRFAVVLDGAVASAHPGLAAKIEAYAARHGANLHLVASPEIIAGGEPCKSDPTVADRLRERVVALNLDRQSFIVAIGGGALLDLVGYVAATVHRGIRLVRLPTTVLAQNDAGIGVKNGVNGFGLKNLFGTFAPPFAVINDDTFLSTLAARDRAAGMAEAIKVALIRDPAFFFWLEREADALRAFDDAAVAHLIRRCAELHLHQIAAGGDPFETGSARPLDFGHWAAHKLETLTGYALRHGEAVAIGIALDARYSVLAGPLAPGEETRICALIEALSLPTWDDALARRGPSGRPLFLAGLAEFREHLGGDLSVTLLADIGRGVEVAVVDQDLMLEAAAWLKARARR